MGLVISTYHGDEETLAGIDDSLQERLGGGPPLSCGMRGGLGGIAIYAASRYRTNPALGDAVVRQLDLRAVRQNRTLSWPISAEYARQQSLDVLAEPIYQPGMAHGHAGILAGLTAMANAGHAHARDLLEPSLNWLRDMAALGDDDNRFAWAFFGDFESGQRKRLNVNTWCTGDPGVLIASFWAQHVLEKRMSGWVADLADRVAREIGAGRRAGMADRIDLCCGMSSVGNICLRLFEQTAEAIFHQAALRCFADAEGARSTLQSNGLQYGRAGVSLALRSLESGASRKWDRFFGMSLPDV